MPKHVCPRCLNEDPKYFYKGSKGVYCRRCIAYGRVLVDDTFGEEKEEVPLEVDAEYRLDFELTKEQKALSHELMLKAQKEDVLVHAVTGAGKTELVMETIREFLNQGKRVGIAIPRRQVVVEIGERMAKAFTKLHVVYVCGGHSEEKEGDLIVCTTHQLYRYYQYFDLLILDAYGIIGLNSKGSANKGFLKLSPILFSPQMRLMIDLRRKHAQNEDLSAKRSAACNSGSTVSDVVPSRLLQRQSAEHTPDVDLHRSTVRYSKDVSLACAA